MVPKAQFFEDIPAFVKESGKEVDDLLGEVQSTLQRYRHVEQQLQEKKMRLTAKKPEIEKCLDAINLLIEKRDGDEVVEVDFSLADQVYARAKVQKDAGYVGLWLGAGVMVEYGLVGFGWVWLDLVISFVACVDSLARSLAHWKALVRVVVGGDRKRRRGCWRSSWCRVTSSWRSWRGIMGMWRTRRRRHRWVLTSAMMCGGALTLSLALRAASRWPGYACEVVQSQC